MLVRVTFDGAVLVQSVIESDWSDDIENIIAIIDLWKWKQKNEISKLFYYIDECDDHTRTKQNEKWIIQLMITLRWKPKIVVPGKWHFMLIRLYYTQIAYK